MRPILAISTLRSTLSQARWCSTTQCGLWNRRISGVSKGIIDVDGFGVGRPGQYVEIDGLVTASHEDSVEINLANVDLDYVFETLNIPNAMFGGVTSGKLYASGLLGPEMVAYTPDLFVKGLKYNFSLMGDTHIKASFDPSAPAVNIDAKVDQPNGLNSYITGYIKPTSEGYLDLTFHADKIEVGFMKPFMSAFASAVHGYASGSAHLFGTFHDVNMSGDIYAEDLSHSLSTLPAQPIGPPTRCISLQVTSTSTVSHSATAKGTRQSSAASSATQISMSLDSSSG